MVRDLENEAVDRVYVSSLSVFLFFPLSFPRGFSVEPLQIQISPLFLLEASAFHRLWRFCFTGGANEDIVHSSNFYFIYNIRVASSEEAQTKSTLMTLLSRTFAQLLTVVFRYLSFACGFAHPKNKTSVSPWTKRFWKIASATLWSVTVHIELGQRWARRFLQFSTVILILVFYRSEVKDNNFSLNWGSHSQARQWCYHLSQETFSQDL